MSRFQCFITPNRVWCKFFAIPICTLDNMLILDFHYSLIHYPLFYELILNKKRRPYSLHHVSCSGTIWPFFYYIIKNGLYIQGRYKYFAVYLTTFIYLVIYSQYKNNVLADRKFYCPIKCRNPFADKMHPTYLRQRNCLTLNLCLLKGIFKIVFQKHI